MKQQRKLLVLLDGNALIHRAYHALPPLTDKEGHVVNAVYGFSMTLLAVLEKFHPEYIAASFDLEGRTFRDDMYADYKATRAKAPDDLYAQIPRVKEVVRAFNIPIYEQEGFEADDCVGTLARQAEQEGVDVIIVTGDNDILQLVTPAVKVFSIRKGIKDLVLFDEQAVINKYGFAPNQLADYKGLRGDPSDNIPGVKGIGEKTATELVQKYHNLESVYAALEELKPAVKMKLESGKDDAFLSRDLGRIHTEVPVRLDLSACVAKDFDRNVITQMFQNLSFFSLIKRLPGTSETEGASQEKGKKEKKTKERELKTKKDIVEFFHRSQGKRIAVWAEQETASLFGIGIQAVYFSNATENTVVVWNEENKATLKTFLEDEKVSKVVYDGKSLMHVFAKEKIILRGIVFDVMLAAYLLNSGGNVELDYLVLVEYGEQPPFFPPPLILKLAEHYQKRLDEVSATQSKGRTLHTVLETIEMPLTPILFTMEQNGIGLNGGKLEILSRELSEELAKLEKDIYAFAGKEFNVNSPKQLAVILFEDLHIPTKNIKKTKTGLSTASPELAKLKAYPIVEKIESYRELAKLKNTYLDVLPGLVRTDGRIHTTFHQTVAATGRLSSADPNLQNIPARSVWSERIRGAFEADPGHVLVGADYSQIELRVMAHLSQDKALVTSFHKGEDVHKTTAAVVYKVALAEVTADMRRQAKVFNFGIMYGMGAYGLAQAAEIDQKEAAEFIHAYFKKFAGVATFIEEMKEGARKHHYVETELGRRRYIPEIESSNVQAARAAERMAINMPIQGLAADIMKLAMLACARVVESYGTDARMVLQVHDELIFEVREEKAEVFTREMKQAMENVYPLTVPLIAETLIGKNWGEI